MKQLTKHRSCWIHRASRFVSRILFNTQRYNFIRISMSVIDYFFINLPKECLLFECIKEICFRYQALWRWNWKERNIQKPNLSENSLEQIPWTKKNESLWRVWLSWRAADQEMKSSQGSSDSRVAGFLFTLNRGEITDTRGDERSPQ